MRLPHLSIAAALSISSCALVLVAVLLVLAMSFGSGYDNSLRLLLESSRTRIDILKARTRAHLDPAMAQARHLATMVTEGHLDPSEQTQLHIALRASLAAAEQIDGALFVGENLRVTLAMRSPGGGTQLVHLDWSGVPVYEHYLGQIERAHEPFWGEFSHVPRRFDDGTAGTFLNARAPVRRDGELLGAFVTSVAISQLSDFISAARSDDSFTTFVLSGRERVIAHHELATGLRGDAEAPLPGVAALDDAVLRAFIDEAHSTPIDAGRHSDPDYEFYAVDAAGRDGEHYLLLSWMYGYGAVPWLVGAHTPRAAVDANFDSLDRAAAAGAAVLLAALLAAIAGARSLSRPVHRLADAAAQLASSGPQAVEALPSSHIRELDAAGCAFNSMLDGLRQRELMRRAFGRFVPEAIADRLIDNPTALAPVTREATALFTDIAGFSTLAEQMPPQRLIELLNAYFGGLIEVIEAHGGVIQQFQGDAILATFNLPVTDPQHAANALRAALDIDHLRDRELPGGIRLATRIGINSGTMVGGTVGGAARVGYTVHGDAVNLAARIQELNKRYATRLLLSEHSAQLAGPLVALRQVGTAEVRGRRRPVTLYTTV